ncbi:hypothetical protein [Winogradskyella poriferorum]|uniref:hypothetical protein n=1 Tax=Winogradskyella poriferorum TaxID=307627 RepID=UPI003D650E03
MRTTLYKIKRKIIRRLPIIKAYLYSLKKGNNKAQRKVVIFAQGRTGSTVLEDLIHSTGHFKKRGEILGHHGATIKYPLRFIKGAANIEPNENFIFHLKIYHLTRDRKQEIDPVVFLNTLAEDGWQILYLRRENKLNHILSNLVAEKRGYFKFDDKKEKITLNLDPQNTIQAIKQRVNHENEELKALNGLDYLPITYEDHLEQSDHHQDTIDKILNYLELQPRVCKTSYKKVNRSTQRDIIENYEEIKALLSDAGYDEFLN